MSFHRTPPAALKSPILKKSALLLLLFLAAGAVCAAAAESFSKEDILARYDRAIALADELRVYEDDAYRVIPRLRFAANALLRQEFMRADELINEVLADLKLIQTQKPAAHRREIRLEWLEIYQDVFQKYAVLVLLAFLFIKTPFFRRALMKDALPLPAKILLPLISCPAAIGLSLFDLSRYGEYAWAFLDLELVLVTVTGLVGGFWPGVTASAGSALFRFALGPGASVYVAAALAAGLAGGLLSRRVASFRSAGKWALAAGLLAGLAHGVLIYLPLWTMIPPAQVLFSAAFVALLEGAGALIFMSVISAALREEDRRETAKELLRTQLLFLQSQMNPHFLYNALNAIAAVSRKENAREAQRLILHLAHFLRRSLDRAEDTITLREEMDYIDAYLEIEKARFQERLRVIKEAALKENAWARRVPALILQPLVENAVKHGIGKKEAGGCVTIRLQERGGTLLLEVEDTGPGMNLPPGEIPVRTGEGTGVGLRNIDERLKRLYGKAATFVFDSVPGRGTRVSVTLPERPPL